MFFNLLAMCRKPFYKTASVFRSNEDLSWIPDAGVNLPMHPPNETPDGVRAVFTFDILPVLLYYNGAVLIEGVGYFRSGLSVKLIDSSGATFAPEPGAVLRAIT